MAYINEIYEKNNLMKTINMLASKLDLVVEFDYPEYVTYGDLVELHTDLVNQYNEKCFNENINKNN